MLVTFANHEINYDNPNYDRLLQLRSTFGQEWQLWKVEERKNVDKIVLFEFKQKHQKIDPTKVTRKFKDHVRVENE